MNGLECPAPVPARGFCRGTFVVLPDRLKEDLAILEFFGNVHDRNHPAFVMADADLNQVVEEVPFGRRLIIQSILVLII